MISKGWLTNFVQGDYGFDGDLVEDAVYTYYAKIVWVGPGGDLWGQYHTLFELFNDPVGGSHGISVNEAPSGFGLSNGWTT